MREEVDQALHEACIRLVAFGRRIQRFGLEDPLSKGVVRVAGGRARVRGASGCGVQATFGIVGVAAQAVADQVAVGVVAIGHAGGCAADNAGAGGAVTLCQPCTCPPQRFLLCPSRSHGTRQLRKLCRHRGVAPRELLDRQIVGLVVGESQIVR